MASTTAEKKYAREYYRKNAKYRRQRIEDRKEYYHDNQNSQNAYAREYYRKNAKYRKYKIKYAADYKKAHKSKK